MARLVTRPEDLPQNVAASIKKYRDMMLRTLEVNVFNSFVNHLVVVTGRVAIAESFSFAAKI